MIRLGPQEIAILTWLVDHGHATAQEIGHACDIAVVSVRGRMVALEKHSLVTRKLKDGTTAVRVYAVTDEGRRQAKG